MSNLFARPGSGHASAQTKRNANVASQFTGILDNLVPLIGRAITPIGQQLDFAQGMEPGRQRFISNNISSLMSMLGSNYDNSVASRMGNNAFNSGISTMNNMLASSPGMSGSMQRGLLLNANNQRANASAQALAALADPNARLQRQQGIINGINALYGASVNSPQMQILGNLMNTSNQAGGMIYGQPQVQQGPGLGDVLGQAAGAFAGAYGAKAAL